MQVAFLKNTSCNVSRLARRLPVIAPKVVVPSRSVATEASMKLYVGNLSWNTTTDDLYEYFSQFGFVEDAFVATDRESGRSRGFGFVTLDSEAAAEAIRQTDNNEFMGRSIRVNEAQPPTEGNRGGGGGGGRGGRGGFRGGRGSFGSRGGGGDRGYGKRERESQF